MRTTILSLTAATCLLIGSVAVGYAQRDSSPGASERTPGHEMQEHGSKPGKPGASGYAPGHERTGDRDDQTIGRGGDRDDRMGRDRDDRTLRRGGDRDDATRRRDVR
jgi:hypothetical protein